MYFSDCYKKVRKFREKQKLSSVNYTIIRKSINIKQELNAIFLNFSVW